MDRQKTLEELKHNNPIKIFQQWLKEAKAHPAAKEPTAMVLSTIDFLHRPTSRVLLLKEIKNDQLIFYTNYNSPKARYLTCWCRLPWYCIALNFYWPYMGRQVRFMCTVKKTSREDSTAYWNSRSQESQISQYISKQSAKLNDRQTLEQAWKNTQKQFHTDPIPCPKHWGGFAGKPFRIEFWQEKPHRLHERLQFKKTLFQGKKWKSTLLCP